MNNYRHSKARMAVLTSFLAFFLYQIVVPPVKGSDLIAILFIYYGDEVHTILKDLAEQKISKVNIGGVSFDWTRN